jgi:hypothetical protein
MTFTDSLPHLPMAAIIDEDLVFPEAAEKEHRADG